jgi:purine-nucleoside phosphorylase
MPSYASTVTAAADFIKNKTEGTPAIGILTGTGLGDSISFLETGAAFDYRDIPHFPVSTVESHTGRLSVGTWQGRKVLAMQGRFHLYEGYTPLEVAFPVRVMQVLGVRTLIVTNAAGGLNPAFVPGDIMVISDHINLTGRNPLAGPNEDAWGPRFPDMSAVYDKTLAANALDAGKRNDIAMQTGVYSGLLGPSLETPAEVRFLRTIGADAVGFSTVTEVIVAVHAGMRVLGLSILTNVHNPDRPEPASVEEIIALARQVAPQLETLLKEITGNIDV